MLNGYDLDDKIKERAEAVAANIRRGVRTSRNLVVASQERARPKPTDDPDDLDDEGEELDE